MPTRNDYLVIGAENSPYSIKVRGYFRYKGIPHLWLKRGQAQEVYQQHAKLPLVPLVVTPDDKGMQDSTPIIEAMEAKVPAPSITPDDPVAAFVDVLLEEFADEWGNKWMFHYRWARDVDQIAASRRLVQDGNPGIGEQQLTQTSAAIGERMVPRVWFVGSNDITAPQIEQSYRDTLPLLDAHLSKRPYLFGGRPASADFALWGQIYNAAKDPTPAALTQPYSHVMGWLLRMVDPAPLGAFEKWDTLAPTLTPLLTDQVGALFLPWSDANATAIAEGKEEFSVQLKGRTWTQKPQKYHARSLAALREKYKKIRTSAAVENLMKNAGCASKLEAT